MAVLPYEKCISRVYMYICTQGMLNCTACSESVVYREDRQANTMNSNCWHSRCMQRKPDNHIIYVSCGGQSNGDSNSEHCFSGNLFDRHKCALCREDHSCVLMHVCEELRPHPSCDRLCGNCIVRGLLTTPEHLTAFCPQRHVTPVITGLLGMTLLQEIQNIVVTVDGQCLDIGRWTWSFEFEKRIDFVIPRSAPSSAKRSGNAHTNTDSEYSDCDDWDSDSGDKIDESACTPMPKIVQSQSMPLRRIQPARKVKDAAAAKQNAMAQKAPPAQKKAPPAQKIPVARKICKKKHAVVGIQKNKVPAPDQTPPAPKKAPPAPKKAPPAPKKAPVRKIGAKRMRWNNLDLLIKVQRDNVCFFYVIGMIYTIACVTFLQYAQQVKHYHCRCVLS